jgi:hypothetical protein
MCQWASICLRQCRIKVLNAFAYLLGRAKQVLQLAFPDREVVMIPDSREILLGGGEVFPMCMQPANKVRALCTTYCAGADQPEAVPCCRECPLHHLPAASNHSSQSNLN